MREFIDRYFKELLLGVAVVLLICIGVAALREHDARILADATVKASNGRIAVLEKDKQDIAKAGDAAIAKLQAQRKAVKTPAQAIAAIPEVTSAPLNPVLLPDAPSAVQVEAVPLFQTLEKCKEDAVTLGTCQATLAVEQKKEAELEVQIAALKKRRSLWKRVEGTAVTVGIGMAIGYAAHR